MLQEQKPKKPPRKKSKPSAMTRPPKRNKKKKKPPAKPTDSISSVVNNHHPPHQINVESTAKLNEVQMFSTTLPNNHRQHVQQQYNTHQMPQHINHSKQVEYQVIGTNEMYTVCENSSAYESSEDTGVGGLSESELIAHDGK